MGFKEDRQAKLEQAELVIEELEQAMKDPILDKLDLAKLEKQLLEAWENYRRIMYSAGIVNEPKPKPPLTDDNWFLF